MRVAHKQALDGGVGQPGNWPFRGGAGQPGNRPLRGVVGQPGHRPLKRRGRAARTQALKLEGHCTKRHIRGGGR